MTIPVDFDDFELASGGVPGAELVLYGAPGPGQLAVTFTKALIDTGAAHTQLPEELALQIGLNPSVHGVPVTISTAAGPSSRWLLRADLEFEGIFVPSVPVYFSPGAVDLVGRSTIYAAFPTTGFQHTGEADPWSQPRRCPA
ncbi:retroviral-like aspartic protease family protein [Nocardia sp. NBC_01377]|uniref:retropepsin-like aspartic protease n=1 Tax=Nocardia sp. NBC_01377 TaxID=2903595 RepID=UPI00324B026D